MSFSLRLRRRYAFIVILIIFLICTSLLQGIASYILSKKIKPKIVTYLEDLSGYRFALEGISFSFLKGIRLSGISVFYNYQDEPPLFIKQAFIAINPLSFFLRGIAVNKIKIDELTLLIKREEEGYNLQVIYSDICKKMAKKQPSALNLITNNITVYIERTKLAYAEEKNISILLSNVLFQQKSDKFRFSGNAQFNYRLPDKTGISQLLKDKEIKQDVRIAVQGSIKDEDLNIDLITLNVGKEQIVGMGINRHFMARNPDMDITLIPSGLSLNNFKFLKDNFSPDGNLFISAKLKGLLDNIKITIFALLDNCSFVYAVPGKEVVRVKNLNGNLEFQNNRLRISNGRLKINDLPLNVEMQIGNILKENPDLYFFMSLPKEFFSLRRLPLGRLDILLKGRLNTTLSGSLEISVSYLRKDLELNMRACFEDIDFDYRNPKEKYFKAKKIGLTKSNGLKTQKLAFFDLKSIVCVNKGNIAMKDIGFSGYNGNLNGWINLDTEGKPLLDIALRGLKLDVKTLMDDMNLSDKILSGSMNARVVFNNYAKEFLQGYCYIQNGVANLQTFTEVIKLPPLKNTNFDIMHAYFSISREAIKVRGVKLYGSDIMLNAYWNIKSGVEGTVNLKIASKVLNQSRQFKKLLRLTKIKTPYIDFKFLLGGIPKATRFMWAKGEFKEKLQKSLPAWIKRTIENRLDKAIDELSAR